MFANNTMDLTILQKHPKSLFPVTVASKFLTLSEYARYSCKPRGSSCVHAGSRLKPMQVSASSERLGVIKDLSTQLNVEGMVLNVGEPPRSSRKLMRVAVDVDEVLGSFLAALNVFCSETYSAHHDISEFFEYDFRKIWKCSQAEANHRVHEFFDSEHFMNGIPPIPGALDALQRLSQHCYLVIVTSRQHVIRQHTLDWIDNHYPGVFEEVHFGNHFALEGTARPKSEICKSLGAELLIDDNPKYAEECANHGIQVLLFDWNSQYPWSKTEGGPSHPLITRVKDWDDVEIAIKTQLSLRSG